MKRSILLLSAFFAATLTTTPSLSHGTDPAGFENRSANSASHRPSGFFEAKPITIRELKERARDEDYVTLRGRFTKRVRGDKYLFTDEAGDTIVAELDDDKDWSHIERDALCEISGKVDKDWNTIELEVKRAVPVR